MNFIKNNKKKDIKIKTRHVLCLILIQSYLTFMFDSYTMVNFDHGQLTMVDSDHVQKTMVNLRPWSTDH